MLHGVHFTNRFLRDDLPISIYAEDDVPGDQRPFVELNAELAQQ